MKEEECGGGGDRRALQSRGITVMDGAPVDKACVNMRCLFPEPCAPHRAPSFTKLSPVLRSHCAGGGGEPAQREECSSERWQDAACPGNICGPVPRLGDGAQTCLCQKACRGSPFSTTDTSSLRWERCRGIFKGKVFYYMGFDFLIVMERFIFIFTSKPVSVTVSHYSVKGTNTEKQTFRLLGSRLR